MTNWKERSQREIALINHQEAEREAARVTLKQQQEAEQETLEALKLQKKADLRLKIIEMEDKLDIPKKLGEINKEFFNYEGVIKAVDEDLHRGSMHSVSLIYSSLTPCAISEATEIREQFGYGDYFYEYDSPVSYGESETCTRSERGFHYRRIEYITGVKIKKPTELCKIEVKSSIDDKEKQFNIRFLDHSFYYTEGFSKSRYAPPEGLAVEIKPEYAKVSFPYDSYNSSEITSFIDAMLLQSCIALSSKIGEWKKYPEQIAVKINQIESRIGQETGEDLPSKPTTIFRHLGLY